MNLTESLLRHVAHPLWLAYKREFGIVTWLRRFQPLWTASRERLNELRRPALVRILLHAAATTKYYSELFPKLGFDPGSVKSLRDIGRLPFLTKEQLNDDIESFLSSAYQRDRLIRSSTGGSSGLPLTFYRDRRVQTIRRAQDYLFNAKLGVFPGMKQAWAWGARMDVFDLSSLKARVSNFLTGRAVYFYAYDATPDKMDEFLRKLQQHRPAIIFAYPNMLASLAKRSAQTGLKVSIPRAAVTAEPLYGWQRELYRQTFDAETFERYGSREIGTVASECDQHQGMHMFEPTYCFEVVDEDGQHVPNGQMGELVVTDLYNYAMPLIRYRTGDMMAIEDGPCGCGCTWRRIVAIGGRLVDMIVRPDGCKVEGLVIVNALHTSGIRARVQVVQKSPTSLIIRCLETSLISEDIRSAFQRRISEVLGASIDVAYEPVKQLRHDPSGKYRYVIRECAGNSD